MTRGTWMFRRAAPASPAWNFAKTLLQIVVMWGVGLALFPLAIDRAAAQAGIAHFHLPARREIGAALFLLFSAGGLWSCVVMVRWGDGTPLPIDATNRLVARGPYAFLRNPMAVCGAGQAAAVGAWLGSWPVMAYAMAGALLWNFVARPAEEADLLHHFGAEYEEYRRYVRCWIPRLTPYRPSATPAQAGVEINGSRDGDRPTTIHG
jgi:protein-S-isoprenylcysteine O-methyltransferase Ste14